MAIKIQNPSIINPPTSNEQAEHSSTKSSIDEEEKIILDKLETKEQSNPNIDSDNKPELIPINVIIGTVKALFDGLSIIHPCWKITDEEASSLVYTLNAAYPEVSIQSFAKIMFWINITMIIVPRTSITIRDIIGKKKSNEIGTNIGQTG